MSTQYSYFIETIQLNCKTKYLTGLYIIGKFSINGLSGYLASFLILLQCAISFVQLQVFQILQINEHNIKVELFTSFQVLVLLAFLAPSTAFWYSPRCTNVDASRAKLEMLLKRIFAASYIFCSKHLSPTCPIFAWFGLEINSSRSARRPVWAKAKINSVSINVSFAFFLAICKNLTRSSRFPKTCFQWSW